MRVRLLRASTSLGARSIDPGRRPATRDHCRSAVGRRRFAATERIGNGPSETVADAQSANSDDPARTVTYEICYFRSDTKYTRVVTANQESLIRKSVRELTAELDPDAFWQIHRSVIVNLAEVAGLQRDFRGRIQLRLKHRPETLPVSHPYSHRFHQM